MSARERLLVIQAAHPLPVIEQAHLAEVAKELNHAANLLDSASVDRVKLLYDGLSVGLPGELRAKVEQGQIVVGEVGLKNPRAYIEKLDANQLLIVMHSGIFEFLYRVARPLSSMLFRSKGEADQIGIDTPELARIVCEIFWWQLETGDHYGPGYSITNDQKHISGLLAHFAEAFLLAHEFGHALIGLTADSGSDGIPLTPAEEEVLADQLGLHMFLSAQPSSVATTQEFWLLSLAYAGAEFALQVWDLMSKLKLDFVDGDHPPSRARIDGLRAVLRGFVESDKVFEELLQIPRMLDKTFNEVARIINARGGEHAALFEQQGRGLVDAIHALLDKCAEGAVPDYLTFYSEAVELMNRGYAHQVLTDVFDTMAIEIRAMQMQLESIDGTYGLQRLNRFKLLFGLVEKMPEPAKSLFRTSLFRAAK